MSKEKGMFLANQFKNQDNIKAHYEITAEEIKRYIPETPQAFVSGVGTGGTLMGTGKGLKDSYPELKIVAIEPEKMPLLSMGEKREQHKIEGIGDDFVPDLINKNVIDDIILINDDDAVNMARYFASDLGIGIGISAAANFIGSVLFQDMNKKSVVTVFPDDNKKYLSTDLSKDIDNNVDFISNRIKLKDFELIIRKFK